MDWHKLQNKLFELDPTDPREDLAKLQQAAKGGGAEVAPTKDYVAESVDVPQGSMPLGLDSIADFAALAGVRLDEKQKMGSAGQAKGKDPTPKTSKPSSTGEQPHPLKDKLVGEDDSYKDFIAKQAKRGFTNYNKLSAIGTGAEDKPTAGKVKAKPAPKKVQPGGLSPQLTKMLQPYAAQLEKMLSTQRGKRQFEKMLPPVQETTENEDIKSRLWAALNAIDKS